MCDINALPLNYTPVLVSFMPTSTQVRVIREEGASVEKKMPVQDEAVGKSVGCFLN